METLWKQETVESAQESGPISVKCKPKNEAWNYHSLSFASEFCEISTQQIKVEDSRESDSDSDSSSRGVLKNIIQPELVEFCEINSHQNPNQEHRQTVMLEKIPKIETEITRDDKPVSSSNQEYDLYNIDSYTNSDPESDPFADVDCDPSFSKPPRRHNVNVSTTQVQDVNADNVNEGSNPSSFAKRTLPIANSTSKHNFEPSTVEHNGFRWQCQLCHGSQISKRKLKSHVEICALTHKDRYRFCIPCNQIFSANRWYKQHVLNVHVIGKPKVCESSFKCEFCRSSFPSKELLSSHSSSHHSNSNSTSSITKDNIPSSILNSRPLKCPRCPSTFAILNNLTHHMMQSHDNENGAFLLICPMPNCKQEYRSSRYFQHHLRRAHSESSPSRVIQSGQQFKCPKLNCGKVFKHNSNLNMHLDISHAKEDSIPLQCPEPSCGKIFKHEGFLKYHLNVDTGECPRKFKKSNAAVQP